jgi:DNA invertase Pin-like site-specific DNA recombinase
VRSGPGAPLDDGGERVPTQEKDMTANEDLPMDTPGPADGSGDKPLRRAAQYIRMSTEHQQYSTENQADVIQEYATRRGYEIVKTYEDSGKSGLSIAGRDSLRQLLEDAQSGNADFETVLAYDVSRWGRFQDSDESAYYEYICKRAGVSVEYCAEQFENDGSPVSTIIKGVKRAMAGEYSRELSAKVFKGQCKLIQLGYRQGGPAGFGLRRMLIDQDGTPKGLLKRGEMKSIQTDRVILVPGPEEEVQAVRRMYDLFTRDGLKESQIAEWMNVRNIADAELGRPWTRSMVQQVLTNEKYIGNNVYNRLSFKLKKKRVRNEPDMWVRMDGAFKPIVEPELFYMARGIILERARRFTDEELLAKLKQLLAAHSALSAALIDGADGLPSSAVYQSRFGSLIKAYRLVGYVPNHDYRYLEINRHLRELHRPLVDDVVQRLEQIGATIARDENTGYLVINGEYTASILLTRCRQTQAGALRWLVSLDDELLPDITVVARMDADNQGPVDYYLLPRIDLWPEKLRLAESNGAGVDTYQRENLGCFVALAARAEIEVAA